MADSARKNKNQNRNRTRKNNLSRFPLNVTNVLGPTARTRFLCDSSVSKEIFVGNPRLVHIKPFPTKRGEGSFGYTESAEMKVNITTPSPSEITCISALKVSKRGAEILHKGIPYDVLTESSVYSRITNTKGLAKSMFIKLAEREIHIVMEHYVMNLKDLMEAINNLGKKMTEPLIRAIVFQVASGLAELHSLGILHKDLKLDNILVAHDGRLLITDYGLSVYNCIDPLKPRESYFKLTTPTIQPPETIESDWVGPAFDIWGLGSTFGSLIVYPLHPFGFYSKSSPWNSSKPQYNWMTAFQSKHLTTPKYTEGINTIIRSSRAQSFSEPSRKLLEKMLNLEPALRPTAQAIVEDPWFAGLTLDEAARTVRIELGTLGLINTPAFKILNSTKIPRNNLRNTNVDKYFNIQATTTNLLQVRIGNLIEQHIKSRRFYSMFTDIITPGRFNFNMYTFLHAIEIFERFNFISSSVTPGNIEDTLYICLMIATKVSPFTTEVTLSIDNIAEIHQRTGDAYYSKSIRDKEIEIIKTLHGDLFPLPKGLVSLFTNVYMKKRYSDPNKKIYRFLVGLLCFICWDGTVGTLQDVFHTADVIIVESGEVGAGIAGSEPNTKAKTKGQRSISSILKENIKGVLDKLLDRRWPIWNMQDMILLRILNSVNDKISTILGFPYRDTQTQTQLTSAPPHKLIGAISILD